MAERTDILKAVLTRDEVTDVLRLLDQEGVWPNAEYTLQDVVDGTHEDPNRIYQALLAVRDPSILVATKILVAPEDEIKAVSDALSPDEVKLVRLWLNRLEFKWKLGWILFALLGIPLLIVALASLLYK